MTLHHSYVLGWKIRTLQNLEILDTHMEAIMKVISVVDKVAEGEATEEDFIMAYNKYRHDIADNGDYVIVCVCNNISSKDIEELVESGVVSCCRGVYTHYQVNKKDICSCCPKQICNVIEGMDNV